MGTPAIQLLPSQYYLKLLTPMYAQAANYQAWLKRVIDIASDLSYCLATFDGAFDLDYAIGVQLNVVGDIVGVSRTVPFQPSGGVSPILDDDSYRLLIKATIANNLWDGKIGSMYPIWSSLFPGGHITIQDNQNMTANIILTGSFTSIIQDLITHDMIVPRPEAVAYTYLLGSLPFFGFDRHDAYIDGWDIGKWS
jgi:hypothetical protein